MNGCLILGRLRLRFLFFGDLDAFELIYRFAS